MKNSLAFATHTFFQQNGFLYVQTPIITTSDCEGAGEMFQVTTQGEERDPSKDFFRKRAFLTVSGQLAVENYCCSLSKVYTFGPTFRAELSNTTRHLAEFWMVEPELAFTELSDVIDCAEQYLRFVLRYVLENNASDLGWLAAYSKRDLVAYLEGLAGRPFRRISYTEAVGLLEEHVAAGKARFDNAVKWGMDLSSEHERYLCEKVFASAVVVHNYPRTVKPFYMRVDDDGKTVQSFDILVPEVGEIVGGSQREERLAVLQDRMRELNLKEDLYWWYLDLRRFGTVPHGGFGVGFERLTMLVCALSNIR